MNNTVEYVYVNICMYVYVCMYVCPYKCMTNEQLNSSTDPRHPNCLYCSDQEVLHRDDGVECGVSTLNDFGVLLRYSHMCWMKSLFIRRVTTISISSSDLDTP